MAGRQPATNSDRWAASALVEFELGQVHGLQGLQDGDGALCFVCIKGDSMRPMKEGWLMFFQRDQSGVPAECRNQLCIVKIADDGPMMVKELRWTKTPGWYNLLSWNADPIEDVALDWAAKVLDIRPR